MINTFSMLKGALKPNDGLYNFILKITTELSCCEIPHFYRGFAFKAEIDSALSHEGLVDSRSITGALSTFIRGDVPSWCLNKIVAFWLQTVVNVI